MTRLEENFWFCFAGVLIGMLLQFRYFLDVDFFRGEWVIMLGILIGYAVARSLMERWLHGRHSNVQE